ncbi:YHYH protein [Yoonia tamlensis]|uniref:YHYH protein n=1 Tax=Yoonia tamlensis TaxID=390270 RepID=A0A1I6G3X9_9RHOB|nr:YHYH protein [Yoonia tamlensis]SFR36918.1 YHYH protein [Yoonia tamlensis]
MRYSFALPALAMYCSPAFADANTDRLRDIAGFFANATVISGPSLVDCTLSGGTQTSCFSITVKPEPQDYTPGPWCPSSVDDTADAGGIWLKDGEVHDVDGAFIAGLAALYGDDIWQLFDSASGAVRVTDTKESCEAAARPDVAPEYQNYCVQCLPEYMDANASMTYVIPLVPQDSARSNRTNVSGAGIASNGVRLDAAAPVDAILAAHTIAPFDDCGGHVNTHVGYHYHVATDCIKGTQDAGSDAVRIGIAMDGYDIYARLLLDGTAPADLDSCNGHVDAGGYHYHAGEAGSNAILSCLKAETGCASENPDQTCDASARPPRP